MDQKIKKFFSKHHIEEKEIKYIVREEGKTKIYLNDNRIVETYTPLKTLLTSMATDAFMNINKGVVLGVRYIQNIKSDIYTMSDGRTFKGRARMPMLYKYEQERRFNYPTMPKQVGREDFLQAFAILDNMPIPFCVLELLMNEDHKGFDFQFRYINEALASLKGVPKEQLLNQSFYSLFDGDDQKWMIAYADIALNGGARSFTDFSPEINRDLTMYCFQPSEGFCACAMIEAS